MSKRQTKRVPDAAVQNSIQEALSGIQKTPDPAVGLSPFYVAEQLFAKVSGPFVTSRTLKQLQHIAEGVFDSLKLFVAGGHEILVKRDTEGDRAAIFTVMEDCPFIISSMIECTRAHNVAIEIILHPILSCGGRQIALSYLVLDVAHDELPLDCEPALKQVLEDVRLVTSSFESMKIATQKVRTAIEESRQKGRSRAEDSEVVAFLEWLERGYFLFLGIASWNVEGGGKVSAKPYARMGIFETRSDFIAQLLEESAADAAHLVSLKAALWTSRLGVRSPVQRRSRMHDVLIRVTEGSRDRVYSIVGLFTYAAHAGTSSSFPIIREKFQQLVSLEKAVPNTYDFKHMVETIDRMPLDDALSLDSKTVQRIIRLAQGIHNTGETRVLVHPDPERRTLSVLVIMGRERYTSEASEDIKNYLEYITGSTGGVAEYHIDSSLSPFARVYYQLPLPSHDAPSFDEEKIEQTIIALSQTWPERLEAEIERFEQFDDAEAVKRRYRNAFPVEYQALHTPGEGVRDIRILEEMNEARSVRGALYREAGPTDLLIIYSHGQERILSSVMPIVEAAGLEVLHAEGVQVRPSGRKAADYIYRLRVREKGTYAASDQIIKEHFCPGLEGVLLGEYETDILNSLMLSAGLSIRQVALLRVYCSHLMQLRHYNARTAVFVALSSHPQAAKLFWDYFNIRFNPDYEGNRIADSLPKLDAYRELLKDVADLSIDRILKALLNLLENTIRTNYFHFVPAIAVKVASRNCEVMPLPRPFVEIFVRSSAFEGVHLRGGPVSRGGLRWSDRPGDFRNEILGLMKTQRIKNVLIAPDGAKGGFVVRNLPDSQPEIQKRVVECYQDYIRALLSITDNRTGGKVVTPARVVAWDGEDPYLVVAADKGTASFSDIANRIAVEEYSFWLGDAFASGGSRGYSHKDLGITAKGAWESVKRHLHDSGLEEDAELTVIGIGDMAGDVFGNGLILSRHFKLVGAFNHRHIFLDPNPDPAVSYAERKRLFDTPGSQWSDYDAKKISKGGGVFQRFAKEIKLNREIRASLDIPADVPNVVDGETLISLILKAPVDLFWNGGIGTYVKSSMESHSDVNDGANDGVRINATDLRCRIVAEGGNLGLTQRARIEFALRGGRVNTDAVDNSAGVDLSDHEVNLKILFAEAKAAGKLKEGEREKILAGVTDEVMKFVLANNRSHARSLTLGERRSAEEIDFYSPLITFLHRNGFINRDLEALPDDDDLKARARQELGLTRPELAVIMAGSKMWLKSIILQVDFDGDEALEEYLLSYFPASVRERFKPEIINHPLARNILALQVVNTIVDLMGMSFVYRLWQGKSATPGEVLKCCIAAENLLKGRETGKELAVLDNGPHNEIFLAGRRDLNGALRRATAWYLAYHRAGKIRDLVWAFSSSHAELVKAFWEAFDESEREHAQSLLDKYMEAGLPKETAEHLSMLLWVRESLQMLWVSRLAGCSVLEAAHVFRGMMREFGIQKVLRAGSLIHVRDKWEYELFIISADEIWKALTILSARFIQSGVKDEAGLEPELARLPGFEDIQGLAIGMQEKSFSVAAMAVLARKLSEACSSFSIGVSVGK